MHYYCMSPKIGTVWSWGTLLPFKGFEVDPISVYRLWIQRKMTARTCQMQLVECRGERAPDLCEKIRRLEAWRQQEEEQQQRLEVLAHWEKKAWRPVPEIREWREQYTRRPHPVRYKFLVLVGRSQVGKTRFAMDQWGIERTLLVSCEGAQTPNLKRFDRAKHECIVFEEIRVDMVLKNRAVFQANTEVLTLGQYAVWLFHTALILCTNVWDVSKCSDEDQEWLTTNGTVVEVHGPLWVEKKRPPPQDLVPLCDS